jgi:gliding motility-associated-like protein
VELSNCHIFDTVSVTEEFLQVNLLPDTAWYCIGENVQVVAGVTGGTYLWSTGSTNQAEIFSTVTTASLIAELNGCTALDTIDIKEVTCHCNFFVPNTFTPNNDHKNETFQPVICPELDIYEFKIFNRWGQEIFSSNDPTIGWDGTIGGTGNGKICPQGVYAYMIHYDSYAVYEKEKVVRGHVTLLR